MVRNRHRVQFYGTGDGFPRRLRSPRARSHAWIVEVKDLPVRLDWIAFRPPGRQSTLEEFDPEELKCQCPTQDGSAGFVAGTSTVNNRILFFRNQGRPL